MRRIFSFLNKKKAPLSPQEKSLEKFRSVFRRRYSHFRTLLTANNNALQAMAELEKAYHGNKSYRMAYIKSRVLAVLVNVYKMVANIREMSDGKYGELEPIFERLSQAINDRLEKKGPLRQGPHVMSLAGVRKRHSEQAGGKMANLGEALSLPGISVPEGFVMTTNATEYFLSTVQLDGIERQLESVEYDDLDKLFGLCKQIGGLIKQSPLPADLEEALQSNYRDLECRFGKECRVALRSSAIGEDTDGMSFAGQYQTNLNVAGQGVIESYKEIIAGKYSPTAVTYRFQRGFRNEDAGMSVGCQIMIDGQVSGVLYTVDPESGKPVIVINAVLGGAAQVVEGLCASERYVLGRDEAFTIELASSDSMNSKAFLSEYHISQLRETALIIEDHFGQPQDIEWSFNREGKLHILQCRPLMIKDGMTTVEASEVTPSASAPRVTGGICAATGAGCGEVFIVNNRSDMCRFLKGAILLVEYPLPEWAPLLGSAAAVIAENGSEAGHLATVCREFGIPALFSVKNAMQLFENGEYVTVNATDRAIYSGIQEEQLQQSDLPALMDGSPIKRILGDILQMIAPLNLLDAEGIYFKPSMCETLHDITRYCHEKSISEMFEFGDQEQFARIAAKRLVGAVPMEWWVIDLADGVKQEADSKSRVVSVEDIVSVPMLAVWNGISAFPWEGPPPVNVRGFGSIIMQSVMRPDLDPAVNSKLTTKNYFLISRNFCNLSVRLGYHYAMIEAFIGDHVMENYITFRFKGGAADLKRRIIRAKLLAEVLESYGFDVELRSDSIVARIKKKPIDYLEERLRILGYLILHARQIDMVMDHSHSVEQYREKFLGDIAEMLTGCRVVSSGGACPKT